ncbi:hypothetical protein MJD09_14575 [bacterium]|nr:hypothetical protein [bacterium]
MAEQKARGNLFYEFLIVVLAALLIGSILYPKKVKEQEETNMEIGRYRMDQILKAQLQYQRYNKVYNDTLEKVIDFIKTSPEFAIYVDTMVVRQIDSVIAWLGEFRAVEEQILNNIPQATDSVMIDSLSQLQQGLKTRARALAGRVEVIHDLIKGLPNMPLADLTATFLIVDSKEFTLDMDIVRNSIENGRLEDATAGAQGVISVIDNVTEQFRAVKAKVPDYKNASLDSLFHCPTTRKPYALVHVDTSAIKYLNIYCPIDTMDIDRVSQDFLKSKVGGLQLINHGKIENGEKSWEST